MANKDELLRKLKALADRGVGGEAVNAAALLERMMLKYGITEEDLDDAQTVQYKFRYSGQFGDKLLSQVIYMVMGNVPVYRYRNSSKVKFVTCTKAEKIEIEAAYGFYRHHLDVGLQKYYNAFVQREGLFPDDAKEPIETAPTVMDPEVELLYSVMDKHDRLLAIEAGTERS